MKLASRRNGPGAGALVYSVLAQADEMARSLHSNLEEESFLALSMCELGRDDFDHVHGGDGCGGADRLRALAMRECEALRRINQALREELDSQRSSYEAQVAKLRVAFHEAQQRAKGGDSPSASSTAESPSRTSRSECSSPAHQEHRRLFQEAQVQSLLADVRARLSDQQVRSAVAEQEAYAAVKEKEDTLRQYTEAHEEVKAMGIRRQELEREQRELQAEVEALEGLLADASPSELRSKEEDVEDGRADSTENPGIVDKIDDTAEPQRADVEQLPAEETDPAETPGVHAAEVGASAPDAAKPIEAEDVEEANVARKEEEPHPTSKLQYGGLEEAVEVEKVQEVGKEDQTHVASAPQLLCVKEVAEIGEAEEAECAEKGKVDVVDCSPPGSGPTLEKD